MKALMLSLLLVGCQSCVPVGGTGGSPGAGGMPPVADASAPDAARKATCASACKDAMHACAKPPIAPSECEARCHEAAIQLHGPSAAPLCVAGVLICNDKSGCNP